jgi:hypothetical protein
MPSNVFCQEISKNRLADTTSNSSNSISNIINNSELISPKPLGPVENSSIIIDNIHQIPIPAENIGNNTYVFQGGHNSFEIYRS